MLEQLQANCSHHQRNGFDTTALNFYVTVGTTSINIDPRHHLQISTTDGLPMIIATCFASTVAHLLQANRIVLGWSCMSGALDWPCMKD